MCAVDGDGVVVETAAISATIASDMLLESLANDYGVDIPDFPIIEEKHDLLARWILSLPTEERKRLRLAQELPPKGVHFIRGTTHVFYDFRNTDIVIEELRKSGAPISGKLLDFGCSSGRNIATLERCIGRGLEYYGSDPAHKTIDWAKSQFQFADFSVNKQEPPLKYCDDYFDLIIAKSIWTHFSERAAKLWFEEMARVLKKGGCFFFSTHGPHDIAYRLKYNTPSPKYHRFTGNDHWTKETFLLDAIKHLDNIGFYFQSYKEIHYQRDLSGVADASTNDWGVTFMLPSYLENELLPKNLKIISHSVGRTGNRHDAYVVQKVGD